MSAGQHAALLYGLGWIFGILTAVLVGATQRYGLVGILVITGGLWLRCVAFMFTQREEWPTFARYWGWFMRPTYGIFTPEQNITRLIFATGNAVFAICVLAAGVLGILSGLGRFEFSSLDW